MAVEALVAIYTLPTVVAADALPIVDLDVCAPLGVSLKEAGNDKEEICQTALFQSVLNTGPAFPFTEPPVLHVWVGDAVVARRRIGIEGHYAIGRCFA